MDTENPLRIESLNKNFAKVKALDNITLTIERGKIYGLLGPNGAGKTTLLRIINNLLIADSGKVYINGRPASFETSRYLGYMPEERGLYEKLTVAEQIMFFGKLKGGKKERLRDVMNDYLTIFNLKVDANRKVKELSKGNQQKVQIISTIVHEPSIIMLDEPFSGFDPINGQLLTQLLTKLQSNGATVILSSHNMPAVEEMCSDIALINRGKLILSGSLEDIKEANKEHKYLIELTEPINISDTSIPFTAERIPSSKNFRYIVKKSGEINNSDFISMLTKTGDIMLFQEKLPTLNELFIKYAH